MKLPSCTARTRSADGLNVTVSERPDRRDALVAEIATVYGPAPTRKSVPGGVTTICAPALATTGAAGLVAGAAAGGAGAAWTAVVPGICELPGGTIDTPGAAAPAPCGTAFGPAGGAGCGAAGAAGAPGAGSGDGAMSGGGPLRPRFCWVPMKIGLRSPAVISCVRTMRGVRSMTMSLVLMSLSFEANSLLSTGS